MRSRLPSRSPGPPDGSPATLRLLHDVTVEAVEPGYVRIAGDAPLPAESELVLELPGERGTRLRLAVAIEPSDAAHAVRAPWRLTLRVIAHAPARAPRPATIDLPRLPAVGVLVRRVAVRLYSSNTAEVGVTSREPLPADAVARLDVVSGGTRRASLVRMTEVTPHHDAQWPWRARVHVLPEAGASARAVRNMMARFEIMEELDAGDDGDRRIAGAVPPDTESYV